ncbi:hypothetical protein Glove_139g278 [Diversispora epigaea]|uniref:Uncharacterized protein n=1 Tax=Diversispora epigaea TaxID=1348612 RepID=A0A397IW47_9GLOM|nr:hypothetical protein Glove_139g278 [Diversispora epigaea]
MCNSTSSLLDYVSLHSARREDKRMICLFTNKSDLKELFEALKETIKNQEKNLNNNNSKSNGNNASEGGDDDESEKVITDLQLTGQIQEFLNQEFQYYQIDLPTGLRLSFDQLEILKGKGIKMMKRSLHTKIFSHDDKEATLKNNVKTWVKHLSVFVKELNSEYQSKCAIQLYHYTPQDEIDKGKFCLSANKSNPKELFEALRKNNLNNNRNEKSFENDYQVRKGKLEILREFMRAIIQKTIEELVDLWDKCLIHQCERDEFFESLQKIESADEYLAYKNYMLNDLTMGVGKTCLNRDRIRKKGPTSFFQSSFRLLEEENEENLVRFS